MIGSVSQAVGLRRISPSEEESYSSGIHILTVCLLWCSLMQLPIALIEILGLFLLPPLQSKFLCISVYSNLIGGNLTLVPLK